jgi:uncharacterized protein Smg (DUF494 family)
MSALNLSAGDLLRIVAALDALADREEEQARNADSAQEAARFYTSAEETRELYWRVAGAL